MPTLVTITKNGSVYDYSDRSIAVVNAPGVLWEPLANMGGLLNERLKDLPVPRGWIFSIKKKEAVTQFLGQTIATAGVVPATPVQAPLPAPEPGTKKPKEAAASAAAGRVPNTIDTFTVRDALSKLAMEFDEERDNYDGGEIRERIEKTRNRLFVAPKV